MAKQEPASIRYKNPGAMWGSKLAIKWGASPRAVVLHDGKNQGNNIAVFPTFVQGICAQLDLWRTGKSYRNKPFGEAIHTWSGGNNVPDYIAFVKKRVPGIQTSTIMDDTFWKGPMAIPFLKAQAWHEAGKPYPAPEANWIEARRRVLNNVELEPEEQILSTVWLQTSLNRLGARLTIDGVPGPATREAIRDFQTALGLEVDGLVGPATLRTLNEALSKNKMVIPPKAPEITLPTPTAQKPNDLAPTFWGRVWALFQPK